MQRSELLTVGRDNTRICKSPVVIPLQASKSYIWLDSHISEPLTRIHSQ